MGYKLEYLKYLQTTAQRSVARVGAQPANEVTRCIVVTSFVSHPRQSLVRILGWHSSSSSGLVALWNLAILIRDSIVVVVIASVLREIVVSWQRCSSSCCCVIHILRLLNVTWFHPCCSNSYRHSSPVVNSSRRSNKLRLIPLSLFVPSAKHLDVKMLKKQASGWICLFLCVSVSQHTHALSLCVSANCWTSFWWKLEWITAKLTTHTAKQLNSWSSAKMKNHTSLSEILHSTQLRSQNKRSSKSNLICNKCSWSASLLLYTTHDDDDDDHHQPSNSSAIASLLEILQLQQLLASSHLFFSEIFFLFSFLTTTFNILLKLSSSQ